MIDREFHIITPQDVLNSKSSDADELVNRRLRSGTDKEKAVFIIELLQCKAKETVNLFDTLWGFFIKNKLHTACGLTVAEAEAKVDRAEFERLKKASDVRHHQCQLKEQIREQWRIPQEEMICGTYCSDDKLGKNSLELIWSFVKTDKDSRGAFLAQFSRQAEAKSSKRTEKKTFGAPFIREVCNKAVGLRRNEPHHTRTNQTEYPPLDHLLETQDRVLRRRISNLNYNLNTSTQSKETQPRPGKKQRMTSKDSCCTLSIPQDSELTPYFEGVCAKCRSRLSHYFGNHSITDRSSTNQSILGAEYEKLPLHRVERSSALSAVLSFISDQMSLLGIHLHSLGTKLADSGVNKEELQAIYMIVRTTQDKVRQQAQKSQAAEDNSHYGSSYPAASDDVDQGMASVASIFPETRCEVLEQSAGNTMLHRSSNDNHRQEGCDILGPENWINTGESSMRQLQQNSSLPYSINTDNRPFAGAGQEMPQHQRVSHGREEVILQLGAQQPVDQYVQRVSNGFQQPFKVATSNPPLTMACRSWPATNMDFSTHCLVSPPPSQIPSGSLQLLMETFPPGVESTNTAIVSEVVQFADPNQPIYLLKRKPYPFIRILVPERQLPALLKATPTVYNVDSLKNTECPSGLWILDKGRLDLVLRDFKGQEPFGNLLFNLHYHEGGSQCVAFTITLRDDRLQDRILSISEYEGDLHPTPV
ncbi:hypothetical protein EV356DRAFT_521074 [Viridothelium virens]|uniref:Uncharacterized protein n=1 Tax=Viridothelium virens TaxID=1048519 RepID=A0A6A6GUH1_VIRVR|nr:hypothetical protein EV356DRAFT_521074 [Viridothelium virens]